MRRGDTGKGGVDFREAMRGATRGFWRALHKQRDAAGVVRMIRKKHRDEYGRIQEYRHRLATPEQPNPVRGGSAPGLRRRTQNLEVGPFGALVSLGHSLLQAHAVIPRKARGKRGAVAP